MVPIQRSTEGISGAIPSKSRTIELNLSEIRKDERMQGRVSLNFDIIHEYAALIEVGVEFPPVRAWFDGTVYWLADGFHRIAAFEKIGATKIRVEVLQGSASEAQWDSYGCNAKHGLRRNRSDLEVVIRRALDHPMGRQLSNSHIARHLGVPEATFRRWRKRLSPPCDEDRRLATRGVVTYAIRTSNIGKSSTSARSVTQSKAQLRESLAEMKNRASPQAHRVLNIIGNWLFGGSTPVECLVAIENLIEPERARKSPPKAAEASQ
jgi:hypothetical protein